MIVMPSNATGEPMRRMVELFPGRLQSLFPPEGWHRPWLPYALDNGAFGAWKNGSPFPEAAFLALCDKAAIQEIPPRWVVCPDAVGNWPATVESWHRWAPRLRHDYGWPLALAVQDGATVEDVLAIDADLLFVGGSTQFKWATFRRWCGIHTRVHVGRVNRVEWALDCAKAGVESIDGTGWMRTDRQRAGLCRLLTLLTACAPMAPALDIHAA